MIADFAYLDKDYSKPGYLAARHIEDLQTAVADPRKGLVWSPAYQQHLMTKEEFDEAIAVTWYTEDYWQCSQMLACFILLANDIPLEV